MTQIPAKRHYALYDANQGNFLWYGEAEGMAEAIRAFSRSCGGLSPTGSQRLGVHEGTAEQMTAIELWTRIPANGFPKDIKEAVVLDASSIRLIVSGMEYSSHSLLEKLDIPIPRKAT